MLEAFADVLARREAPVLMVVNSPELPEGEGIPFPRALLQALIALPLVCINANDEGMGIFLQLPDLVKSANAICHYVFLRCLLHDHFRENAAEIGRASC